MGASEKISAYIFSLRLAGHKPGGRSSGKWQSLELGCKQHLNRCFDQDIFRISGVPPPWGIWRKNLLFHMTPHLLSFTFRITSPKGLNFNFFHKIIDQFSWSRNARRLHRDVCNLYGKYFSTQHRVRDQTP